MKTPIKKETTRKVKISILLLYILLAFMALSGELSFPTEYGFIPYASFYATISILAVLAGRKINSLWRSGR